MVACRLRLHLRIHTLVECLHASSYELLPATPRPHDDLTAQTQCERLSAWRPIKPHVYAASARVECSKRDYRTAIGTELCSQSDTDLLAAVEAVELIALLFMYANTVAITAATTVSTRVTDACMAACEILPLTHPITHPAVSNSGSSSHEIAHYIRRCKPCCRT